MTGAEYAARLADERRTGLVFVHAAAARTRWSLGMDRNGDPLTGAPIYDGLAR